MQNRKRGLAVLGAAMVVVGSLLTGTAAVAQDDELVVGVSWNNFNEERWARDDEPNIVKALDEVGAKYIKTDAGSSEEQQIADVENLITQGADAIIILAQNSKAILPAVQSALDQGIPVVAYDRLFENPGALYVTFDNVGVGRAIANVLFPLVPKGTYALIKGNEADENTRFLRQGMFEVIGAAVEAGDIVIPEACEAYSDNWLAENAKANMEACLTATDNKIDAALVENDGMAGGVISALADQGMAGTIPVGGQDGEKAALNRVALGLQAVSVWKDARNLGYAAGKAAAAMAQGTPLAEVEGTVQFDAPGGTTMTSIFLEPTPILKDNIGTVVDAGVLTLEELCIDVPAGSAPPCP